MKYTTILFVIALACISTGCQTETKPMPGMANLRVMVAVDPKAAANARPSIYAESTDVDYAALQQIDYAHLHDVVVWVEDNNANSAGHDVPKPITVELNSGTGATGLAGAVCVGQTINFHNATFGSFNVYSVSDGNFFNLGTLGAFQNGAYQVKSPGLIEVRSQATTVPLALIYATPTGPAYLTQPGSTVDFNNLPPGHYQILTHHLQVPGSVTEVDLAADKVAHATIEIGGNVVSKGEEK